jgi:hypothetical protein
MRARGPWILLACLPWLTASAHAEDDALRARLEVLERRNAELETRVRDLEQEQSAAGARDAAPAGRADWTDRVRLSGSANAGYYRGGSGTPFDESSFQLWDARLFVDADLGDDVRVGNSKVANATGLTFEWQVLRLGELQHEHDGTIGEMYFDVEGVGGFDWLNAQVGRFQLPVGENYRRFSRGYRDNPFISNTVGGPWWWDEGVRLHGSSKGTERSYGYVLSLSDGETDLTEDANRDLQSTLKLWARPWPWLQVSASMLRSGAIGSDEEDASGALWLGETWATPLGLWTDVPTFHEGAPVPDGPSEIADTTFLGSDVVLSGERAGRLWLAWGRYGIDSTGASLFDRTLHYWVAEWVFPLRTLSPELTPFYLALRANGLGTYDDDEGYLLDSREDDRFGYNMESLEAFSIGLGWHLNRSVTLRAEFTHLDVGVVRGVSDAIEDEAGGSDYFGLELGAAF